MMPLSTSTFRIVSCLIWCLSWPVIAGLLLKPLPFALVARTDLLGHFLLFGLMTAFLVLFVRRQWQLIGLVVLTILLSAGFEVAQDFVPNRFFDPVDMAATFVGGLAGGGLAVMLLQLQGRPMASANAKVPS